MAFVLGGITLDCPPTIDNYRVVNAIVSGREATALSGVPLELGVIRKKIWTLTFYPGAQYAEIMALVGTECTFVDHDGASYTVKVTGEPSISQYPLVDVGLLTITLREV
jgi:hypothetical protein